MKVLMINYEYPPIGGGTAKACGKVIGNMQDKDIDIHLLTSSSSGYSRKEEEGLTVERIDVNKRRDHEWRFSEVFWFIIKASYRARKLSKKDEFDLVHAWTGFPCGVVAKSVDIPYIVSLRGGDVPGFDERFSVFYPFLTPLIKSIWSDAGILLPNSEGLKDLAKETMDVEMNVISNGVETGKFYAKDDYSVEENELNLVTVCRLTDMKRVSDIIRAISDNELFHLQIIGTGEKRAELENLADELDVRARVKFEGYIENDELPDYLNGADIFVLPSLNEGMSNAILEAMASGLPIITTDVGGSEELIDGNGFVVDKKSPSKITEVLENYKENPDLLETQGRRSREIAESMDWETVSEKFYRTYIRFKA